jgi:uncharacterized protein (TIGR02145 family)
MVFTNFCHMKTQNNFIFILFVLISFTLSACKKESNISLPSVITYSPLYIASTSATLGCTVPSDGGSAIINCGIYIGTSQNPEKTGLPLQIASDTGAFLGQVNGLLPSTQYYVKAYAKNAKGESLGDQVNFTTPGTINDFDNNIYETVKIGTQLWMAKNLSTTHYDNSDQINTTSLSTSNISVESSPEYQWSYDGADANAPVYGKLYTYYTITDSRLICPAGWHVPTDAEWTTLETTLGGFLIAGSELKEAGNSHWIAPYNLDATNESCFKALPGGYRIDTGVFSYLENYGYWWSSTTGDTDNGWVRSLFVQSGQITRMAFLYKNGASVRCLKD